MDHHPLPAGSYWVGPGFIAGPYPFGEVQALLSARVSQFIDLTEEGELGPYPLPTGIGHLRLPIQDFTVPSHEAMKRILDSVDSALREGHTIYLHCRGGLGRTGTVVGCFLVRHGMTGAHALAEIRRLRAIHECNLLEASPETEAQCAMVRSWLPGL